MSGNRLPGDSETNDRHRDSLRIQSRVKGGLRERYEAYQEEHGLNDADLIRDALRQYLPHEESVEYVRPRDDDLASAYFALAGDEKRVYSIDNAAQKLARTSHPSTKVDVLKYDLLRDLADTGLVGIASGQVGVHPLTPTSEVEL